MRVSEQQPDYILKVILVGDSGVGKSKILKRYTENEFSVPSKSTLGVDYATKYIEIDDYLIKVQIWDTAGQPRFRSITSTYYRGIDGVFIVFDVTKKETFDGLSAWLNEVNYYSGTDPSIVILGNKSDLKSIREVSNEQIKDTCFLNNLQFIETSAKTPENINEAFDELLRKILKTHERNKEIKIFAKPDEYFSVEKQ